jgi:hypothetical protein
MSPGSRAPTRRGKAAAVLTVGIGVAVALLLLGPQRQPRQWMVRENGTIHIPAAFASAEDTYTCVAHDGPYRTWGPMDLSARGQGVTSSTGDGFGVDGDGSVFFRCGSSDYQL